MKKGTRRKVLMSFCAFTMLFALLIGSGIGETAKKAKLIFWLGYPEVEPIFARAIKDYKVLHPDVEIKVASFKLREQEKKLSMGLPMGKASDMFDNNKQFTTRFIEAGFIQPNPPKVNNFGKSASPVFYEKNLLRGNYYGLPWFTGGKVMFWNKTMFKEAALPGPPETWGDLIYFSQKLAKYGPAGNLTRSGISLRLSGSGSGVGQKFEIFLLGAGGALIEETPSGKYHNGYDNVAGRDTLQLYIDLVHKYHVDDYMIKHDAEAFALEKTAMFEREGWVVGYTREHAPQVDFDTAQVPKFRRKATICGVNNLYVTNACKYPEIAWDFLLFMEKTEYMISLTSDIGWPAARTDISYEDVYKKVPQYRAFVEFPEDMLLWDYPALGPLDEIETKFSEKLVAAYRRSDLVDNPQGIAEVIAVAAKETDELLKKAGLYGLE